MGNPTSRGQQRDKPYRDALRRAIARAQDSGSPHRLDQIAEQHLIKAYSGDVSAMKELADRLDGKVPQSHIGDDEADPITVRQIITGVPRKGDVGTN